MTRVLKPGGELVVDFYPIKGWYTPINAKYLLRPILKHMDHERLLRWIKRAIPLMQRVYFFNRRHGLGLLNRFVPVSEMPEALKKCLSPRKWRNGWCWIPSTCSAPCMTNHSVENRAEMVSGTGFYQCGCQVCAV
jgi:hypothetical protein